MKTNFIVSNNKRKFRVRKPETLNFVTSVYTIYGEQCPTFRTICCLKFINFHGVCIIGDFQLQRMMNVRCYACGDRGHKEINCVSVSSRDDFSGRLRYAQPTFELVIRDIERVFVRDRVGDEFEVRAFGLMVTNDNLRVVKDAERIAFFGTPMRDRDILVMLPNVTNRIRITWSEQRVAIDTRFIATNNSLQVLMSPAAVPPVEYDFTVRCVGREVSDIGFNLFAGTEINEYMVHVNDRQEIVVAPVFVATQLRQMERDRVRQVEEANQEAVNVVTNQLIVEVVDDVAALNLRAAAENNTNE